jgi:tetrapyrrole methylase family protein/MazG family protein
MENLPHLHKTPSSEADWCVALANLARYLRSPDGCPWDRKQRAVDFARYAAEESRELVEALESGDHEDAAEEFGDALFVLLAAMAAAEEEGRFRFLDALKMAHEKMVRRHGHVFGPERTQDMDEILAQWERVKAEEKRQKGKG